MSLYLVEHKHSPENCPTRNPEFVKQLAGHMTPENAQKHGIKMLGDWVNDDQHRVVLVFDSDTREKVVDFVRPFEAVGSVAVSEGTTCEDLAKKCLAG